MDDNRLFGHICPISHLDGYNGTIRSCETSNKVLKVECNKANITDKALLYTLKSLGNHVIVRKFLLKYGSPRTPKVISLPLQPCVIALSCLTSIVCYLAYLQSIFESALAHVKSSPWLILQLLETCQLCPLDFNYMISGSAGVKSDIDVVNYSREKPKDR